MFRLPTEGPPCRQCGASPSGRNTTGLMATLAGSTEARKGATEREASECTGAFQTWQATGRVGAIYAANGAKTVLLPMSQRFLYGLPCARCPESETAMLTFNGNVEVEFKVP